MKLYRVQVYPDAFLVTADSKEEATRIAKEEATVEWLRATFFAQEVVPELELNISLLQRVPYGSQSNKTAFKHWLEQQQES